MDYINGRLQKNEKDHYLHFRQRLQERYGLDINAVNYDNLYRGFHGVFKKGRDKTIGWVQIDGTKIWALYHPKLKCFSTCYPANIETSISELIYCCFGGSLRELAMLVYNKYLEEDKLVRKVFADDKEAAIWYFENTLFPVLHIDKYKHGEVKMFKIMGQIKKVLLGSSPYTALTLSKKDH